MATQLWTVWTLHGVSCRWHARRYLTGPAAIEAAVRLGRHPLVEATRVEPPKLCEEEIEEAA